MIARAGSGWQTILADLSLILFMITASALRLEAEAPAAVPPHPESPIAEPLAFYEADAGAPPIGEWLQSQSPDTRQQLTIVSRYAPGGQARALAEAARLAGEAQAKGMAARVVVEPAEAGAAGTSAMLAYDRPGAGEMARGLLENGQATSKP